MNSQQSKTENKVLPPGSEGHVFGLGFYITDENGKEVLPSRYMENYMCLKEKYKKV